MQIEKQIEAMRREKKILLMTHQIIGYPDFAANEKAIECFYNNGVDLIELQIPFSDPIADGPVFTKSNQAVLEKGIKVSDCLKFIERMARKYPIPFLVMTYYNILYQYGVEAFIDRCKEIGVQGTIVPDAPLDEARVYYDYSRQQGLAAVSIATPYSDPKRLQEIADIGSGFIYYVPRKGVTGSKTTFDSEILDGIQKAKKETGKTIAVGFGIQGPEDVAHLIGTADIAIIGSKIQLVLETEGLSGLDQFLGDIARVNKEE
ncbi:MAG: tryptophan synthase subunit alpha [Dehalobacter sp. 4CP]|uniref:tryptophan synthase subunit alpha n=1 Tax=Dehalobacter sp. CP TaxID=2594474 RepID=UPI0013CC724F|nr:tryptophan synthase subunit alpha [Dehalobacter sp. 4CP]